MVHFIYSFRNQNSKEVIKKTKQYSKGGMTSAHERDGVAKMNTEKCGLKLPLRPSDSAYSRNQHRLQSSLIHSSVPMVDCGLFYSLDWKCNKKNPLCLSSLVPQLACILGITRYDSPSVSHHSCILQVTLFFSKSCMSVGLL